VIRFQIEQLPGNHLIRGSFASRPSLTQAVGGKRLKRQYVRASSTRSELTVYVKGRIYRRWPYPFLHK
jgi:hypothetical protein